MKAFDLSEERASQVRQFVRPESHAMRYLFGCNEHSKALSEVINVDGFIDDFRSGAVFNGKAVLAGNKIPNGAWVVNCSLSIRPLTAEKRIKELNPLIHLSYHDFLLHAPDITPIPSFVRDAREDVANNLAKWTWLEGVIAEESSMKVLADMKGFRTSADLGYMTNYAFDPKGQYFDGVCDLGPGEVFVDCGGFDGDTTELFLSRCPKYKRVWFFEPSPANMALAKKRLAANRDIMYIPKGVSDAAGVVSFNSGAGSASTASANGDIVVELETIDKVVSEPVSFIKMDLEGWELKALKGSESHILNDHPKLAIAVYHEASHFWRIPELVLGMRSDYQIFLRHYTEGWSETIMYFIPRR